ncbi:MAG TPA: CBS domain-containing protein [Polyangiaceae bacterium LLY-WYZ-15_(1-7)]|nr:CBS domain-containing protein [Polyangiaceae bacterium LLY-WYZ-15_(1-7)]HJL03732.1 CBS domain-containing protein [Polyangiaceae bacterium LLY-WYZ-15_(1-7)]HJL08178.1 CBS domain-containing protein [Polyangiaceae bacterium LLY-WYZ-15_(1-7)]HJL28139.1 CBS domain-containing protein [Polyangiaceae bacterium LLY-WYZ-15_(1-7)]HJL36071.1 CBS domain-containing protein [Polyangiaceae bacterium LLY-WYZ-15_(1-7)]
MSAKLPTLAGTMTPFPYSIPPGATLHEARKTMQEHGIHHLPVQRGDAILGMVATEDLLAAEARGDDFGSTSVAQVYVSDPYVVDLHAPLVGVVREIGRRRIDSAVVTREGKLAGIVTTTDICEAFADFLQEVAQPPPPGGSAA